MVAATHDRTATNSVAVRSVGKVFPGGVEALRAASFDVEPGSFVSLVGPSGCGKSTLLRLVSGLLEPTSGVIEVAGTPVEGPRSDIGFMFQKPNLLPWRTALENVLLPVDIGRRSRSPGRGEALELLDMVGLTGFEHHYPAQLSGGMQQRVALSRLLMTGAELLLLDEPFGALDEFTRERLNLEVLRIHEELRHTALFVTHNIAEAIFMSDTVVVMSSRPGRISAVLDIPFDRPRTPALQREPEFTDLVFHVREILGEAR